jgi:hypothetical protein
MYADHRRGLSPPSPVIRTPAESGASRRDKKDTMKRTLTLAAAMAVGYVAGAKAGREKYDQMHQKVREIGEKPTVAEVRRSLRQRVDTASRTVAGKITDIAAGSSKESDVPASTGSC